MSPLQRSPPLYYILLRYYVGVRFKSWLTNDFKISFFKFA